MIFNVFSKEEIDGGHALASLVPTAEYGWNPTDGIFSWDSKDITQPTQSEIDAEVAKLREQWVKEQYKRDRENSFPTIQEQLDLLWHDIENGKLDTTGSFFQKIKSVKDANPKS